jgi:integrase
MPARSKKAANRRKLTELYVQNAKAVGLTWDTYQHGLVLRVRPSGSRSWYAYYSRHGRPRWMSIGPANAIGLADARDLAAEIVLAARRGGDPAAEKKAERGTGSFAELAAKYLEGYAKRHNKSWRQAAHLVERFAIPKWGKLQASAITRGDIKAMMAKIEAPIVANQTLAAVSAVFSWAIKEELVTANPCKLVERNPTRSRERILSDSEIPKFWEAFDAALDPVRGAALKTILLTGQRPGEVAHMRVEHIVDGWWTMPGEASEVWPGTKNKNSNRVWLARPLQALLDLGGGDATGYVFPGARGGPLSKLDDAMRAICTKLDVERATPHDLRRTFGSLVTAGGHGRQAMDRILNHADSSVGSIYDRHSYAATDAQIMESVANKIMALVERRPAKVIPLR